MKLNVLVLLLLLTSSVSATTITVCSSGCDYSTMAGAIAAAGSTDDIDLQGNITENITLNKNIAGILSSNGSTWNSNSGGSLLQIQSGLNQAFYLRGINFTKNANGTIIFHSTSAASTQIEAEDCTFDSSGATNEQHCIFISNNSLTDAWVIDRCIFIGGGKGTINGGNGVETGTGSSADHILIKNSIFRDFGVIAIQVVQPSSNDVIKMYNCTVDSCVTGVDIQCSAVFQNNSFTDNTTDFKLQNNASLADIEYGVCGGDPRTTPGTNPGTLPTSVETYVTPADIYTNPATNDYSVLNDTCLLFDTGNNLTAITTADVTKIPRPQNADYDIGAYELQETPTFTLTATPTSTNTPTHTFTSSPTNTPTYTFTNSPTSTVTNTFTNSPTYTFTNSPTSTVTNTFTNSPTSTVTNTFTNSPTITQTQTPSDYIQSITPVSVEGQQIWAGDLDASSYLVFTSQGSWVSGSTQSTIGYDVYFNSLANNTIMISNGIWPSNLGFYFIANADGSGTLATYFFGTPTVLTTVPAGTFETGTIHRVELTARYSLGSELWVDGVKFAFGSVGSAFVTSVRFGQTGGAQSGVDLDGRMTNFLWNINGVCRIRDDLSGRPSPCSDRGVAESPAWAGTYRAYGRKYQKAIPGNQTLPVGSTSIPQY